MADCGMSPTDALVATTRTAADLLGVSDELGTLEPGKRADLVVVDGDPLELDKLPDRITQVWKDGARRRSERLPRCRTACPLRPSLRTRSAPR